MFYHKKNLRASAPTDAPPAKRPLRVLLVLLRFVLSSLSSSALDFGLFWLLCNLLRAHIAAYILAATVLARVVSATYNYTINYALVFRSKASKRRSALGYAALALAQMTVSGILVTLLYYALPLNEVLTKALVDGTLFFISFSIQRRFIYRAPHE